MLVAALPGHSKQTAPASASFKDIDYEIDGTVLEGGTGVPLAGAYVALMYTNPGDTDEPHSSRDRSRMVCLKVKGAYVDAEGHFKLPAEKVDDLVAYRLIVIKPDHYIVEKTMPATSSAKHGGKPRVEVRFDVDPRSAPAGPERRGEDDSRYLFEPSLDCWHARFREDAAPAIPFLEILRGELPKHDLGNEGRNAKGDVARAGHVIYLLN